MTGLRDKINGHWELVVRSIVGVFGAFVGAAIVFVGMGVWAGSLKAEVESHILDHDIHPTQQDRQQMTERIIDREVAPILAEINAHLKSIDTKLDKQQGK